MTQVPDAPADRLRQALRSLQEPSPSNELARASILAAVRDDPGLYAIALEEVSYPQVELDLHLVGATEREHATRADWLGHFIARLSAAVNEVTKSLAGLKRMTPGLQVLAPAQGSVRVVVRASERPKDAAQGQVEGADDTTTESKALTLVTALLKMAENPDPGPESPLTAATQGLSPIARQRVRSVARSVIEAGWTVEGTLNQRGQSLESVHVDPDSATRLFDALNRVVTTVTYETLLGLIDGERRSLSTMWFVPDGQARAFEVAVTDDVLLSEVRRLAAEEAYVRCAFVVFLSVPPGSSQAASRSRELQSIRPVGHDTPMLP